MSEEERKAQHKAIRILSIIALGAGVATSLSAFWYVREILWFTIYPDAGQGFGYMDQFFGLVTLLPFPLFLLLFPAGLVLSIVTLFIERNKCLRLLPLALVVAGFCLFWLGYILSGFQTVY